MKFRDFVNDDIALYSVWLNKDYVKKWYGAPEDWLCEVSSDEYNWINHFIVEYDNKSIGFCQYYEYVKGGETWHGDIQIEGTYSIDYVIGEEDYLGKGLGRKIIVNLTNMIFEQTNAQRVIVQPDDDNHASNNTLLSAGYKYDKKNKLFIYEKVN